ncbi:hypothetical protein BGX24_009043 [Mortierella sp. AD032]|nr:hypothetical protein BGX24_009043 [Mortierella sp. AD032]
MAPITIGIVLAVTVTVGIKKTGKVSGLSSRVGYGSRRARSLGWSSMLDVDVLFRNVLTRSLGINPVAFVTAGFTIATGFIVAARDAVAAGFVVTSLLDSSSLDSPSLFDSPSLDSPSLLDSLSLQVFFVCLSTASALWTSSDKRVAGLFCSSRYDVPVILPYQNPITNLEASHIRTVDVRSR